MYRAGVLTGGMFSVPVVRAIGVCFMATGIGAILTPHERSCVARPRFVGCSSDSGVHGEESRWLRSSPARKIGHEGSARQARPGDERRASSEIATSLDRLLHDTHAPRHRQCLAATDDMSFTDLKSALNATDGNLSVHARSSKKPATCRARNVSGLTPRTEYTLTASGRRRSKSTSTPWTPLFGARKS